LISDDITSTALSLVAKLQNCVAIPSRGLNNNYIKIYFCKFYQLNNQCMTYDKVILVTGGAGFIGSHLVDLLVRKYNIIDQIAFVQDRAGHDFRYATDSSKIQKRFT
jgi:hypothetical protein